MTTATETAVVAATKTYDRPYLPRGAYFAMLREQGLLKPRERSAASAKPAASKKATAKKASKATGATKAAKDPNAPKKVYDTPYMPKGQWFKMMRETGQLAPRQPKAQPAAEAAVAETAVA